MGIVMDLVARPSAVKTLSAARTLLQTVTPLGTDCGKRCQAACCQPDTTGENGMLLFPFEDWFYRRPIDGFPFRLIRDDSAQKGGKRLVCQGHCPREHRPLACRLFPLRLQVTLAQEGALPTAAPQVDPRSFALCPLPQDGRLSAFHPDFVQAVAQAGTLLVQNLSLLEFMVNEQDLLEESRRL